LLPLNVPEEIVMNKEAINMLDKFTSVTRATIKGTAVIGMMQGGVGGIAFAVVGIPSAGVKQAAVIPDSIRYPAPF
jgi:predicted PurR-regulated permease PerM